MVDHILHTLVILLICMCKFERKQSSGNLIMSTLTVDDHKLDRFQGVVGYKTLQNKSSLHDV